jgi:pyrimidine 5'-nucleotidase
MSFEALFFDLDDTLYPSHSGIWEAVGERMNTYMMDVLGFDQENVARMRDEFWQNYGTTFRGLRTIYNIEPYSFLDYVHDIPLPNYIQRDENLVATLKGITGRKIIFTNASRRHAENVLNALGLSDLFEQIIDVMKIDPYCKPLPEAFQRAIELAQINDPGNCVVIDDQARNLQVAHEMGFFTIQVGTEVRAPFVDVALLTLNDLAAVIPVTSE